MLVVASALHWRSSLKFLLMSQIAIDYEFSRLRNSTIHMGMWKFLFIVKLLGMQHRKTAKILVLLDLARFSSNELGGPTTSYFEWFLKSGFRL